MKFITAVAGGFAGACALTFIHETLRQVDKDAPRMDLLGMEAIAKTLVAADKPTPQLNALYGWTMAADIISNGIYYSFAGAAKKDKTFMSGALLGAAAGIGAVVLPGPLGLVEETSNRTNKTRLLTIGLYLAGGIIAAKIMNRLEQTEED